MAYTFDEAPGCNGYSFSSISPEVLARLNQGDPSPTLAKALVIGPMNEVALASVAVETIKAMGAEFGDLRLGRDVSRYLITTDMNIKAHQLNESMGIGIRALYRGFWGFAATDDLTESGVMKCATRAVDMAKGVALVTPKSLGLNYDDFATEPKHVTEFNTPVGICPFGEKTSEIAQLFRESSQAALDVDGIQRTSGMLSANGFRRLFVSTEGSQILTTHSTVDVQQTVYAVKDGNSAYRTIRCPGIAGGLEHFYDYDILMHTNEAAKEAILKCGAKQPKSGKYSLILDGHNLGLTMHESVGHPTELDRVLGYELGFAGGSFASLDKLGGFQYGSPIVNFTANNKLRFGPASQGFDDEGVACQEFPVIRDGVLVGYGTSRETAHKIGSTRANGTCRATNWSDVPIVRIPNLFLEPGKEKLSRQELIEDTKDGILMMGRDSFSIDQMRYNFQFGADMCYRIENGKITEPLKDVIYQSISPEFWNSCDAICDETEWQMHGVVNCGKGQPTQRSQMMHGASPSRFTDITVGY